jgi:hypothetical protein
MTYTQQVKLIREAFDALPDMHDGWTDVKDRLHAMNVESERGHRRHRPAGLGRERLSVHDAARLFVVSHLLDGFKEPDRYSVDDIISIRNEVLYAQAWAKKFHKELAGWAAKYQDSWKQVDYVELVKEAA